MKKLILGLLVLVSFQQASAKAREFRILSDSVKGNIALAWGVRGTTTDFETYDALGEDAQLRFLDKNSSRVQNYLVDLKTSKVLAVVRQGDADQSDAIAEFSKRFNTNHNEIFLQLDPSTNVGMFTGYRKWFGGAEMLFALETNKLGQTVLGGICNSNCEEKIIISAAKAAMTKAQLADYEKYEFQDTGYELVFIKGIPVWKVTLTSQEFKGESTTYVGNMRLTFAEGKFSAAFGKIEKQD